MWYAERPRSARKRRGVSMVASCSLHSAQVDVVVLQGVLLRPLVQGSNGEDREHEMS